MHLDLNWLTENASTTHAGKAFHSLTTLYVKKLAICKRLVEYWPESLLLCPLILFFLNSLFKLIIFNIKIIRARTEPLQPINKFKKRKKKGKKVNYLLIMDIYSLDIIYRCIVFMQMRTLNYQILSKI